MKALIVLCLILPLQAFSDTSLWRISKNGRTLFIGGTVHILDKRDYPLPSEFNLAYKKSQILVLETDLEGFVKPEIKEQLLQKLMYDKNENLQNHLKPTTYKALDEYLQKHNMSITSMQQFKPSMVMLTLMMLELQRLNLADAGVDEFFNEKARSDSKNVGQLESIEKQIDVLSNIGKGHEDELILSTLDDLRQLPSMMNDLKNAWRKGDLKQLEVLGIAPMQKDYPALYQMLLVERNLSWLPQIEAFINTPETELILIGALHLAGKDGLLAQLSQRGYKVEPF
jgi:uncharacterized protein YbaP (TraB family)